MEEDPGVGPAVAAASSSSGSTFHATQAAGSEAVPGSGDAAGSGTSNAANEAAAPPPCSYEVNVKAIDGTVTKLQVPSNSSGVDLKDLISKRLDVAPEKQRLIIRGHAIKDDDVISQHLSDNGQTVHLVQRPDMPPALAGQQAATSPATQPQSATQPAAGSGQVATAGLQVRLQLNASMPQEQQLAAQLLFGGQSGNGAGGTGPSRGPLGPAHVMLGQPLAAMALPATPIVFQQGQEQPGTAATGNALTADLISALLGSALQQELVVAQPTPEDNGGNPGVSAASAVPQVEGARVAVLRNRHVSGSAGAQTATQEASGTTGVPPWSELQVLTWQLARLLHRAGPGGGSLPPAHMPQGELHAFLGALHGASSQLGVGICDLQACLSPEIGDELRMQQASQFAETAEAAAALLQRVASHLRGGAACSGGNSAPQPPQQL
mmetsp:Transcript_31701/g.62263  ORF Transcript_31701/g.62263 Transcript_31701/m.62263 type:complete len:437 (-) Transcript_31701:88-1398(-)